MNARHGTASRRAVLRGAGGAVLALPWLEAFDGRAHAAPAPVYTVIVVGCNGVVQDLGSEPERFWPSSVGSITRGALEAEQTTRAAALLSRFADRMLLVRGIHLPFSGMACAHTNGDNQCLTAARPSGDTEGAATSLARGESVDHRIATAKNPAGRGPLTLHAGANAAGGKGYGNPGYVSYKAALQPNSPESSPLAAYMRMVGLGDGTGEAARRLAAGRVTVNDLVRRQLRALLSHPRVGTDDKRRLDQHLQSIRDLEGGLVGTLAPATVERMKAVEAAGPAGRPLYHSDERREETIRLHMDVIALAFASDYTRVATLKIGDNNDGMKFVLGGMTLPSFHMISHRVLSDGGTGPAIPNAVGLHAEIDRRMIGHFGYFCDRLAETDASGSKLLDRSLAIWTNQVGNGNHDLRNIPTIIVGTGGGAIRSGRFLDVGGQKNNKLWNTVLAAAGVTHPNGARIEDFGDPTLAGGILDGVLA